VREPERFHALDALRGAAALSVVFWHWQNFFFEGFFHASDWQPEQQPLYVWLRPLYDSGDRAVDLFFALSGFIFFWLYGQRVAQGQISGPEFLRLRFSRLYPLHLVTLLLVAVGQWLHSAVQGRAFVYPGNDGWHFALHLLLASSVGLERDFGFNAPTWSVSVEAVLYLMFFLVCRRFGVRPLLLALLALLGFFLLSRLYLPLGRGVGSFFLGGCIFHLYRWILQRDDARRWASATGAAALLLWAVVLLCSYTGWSLQGRPWLGLLHWKFPLLVLFPLTILAVALAESAHPGLCRRVAWLGDISYSSYLWHFPLQLACALTLPLWVSAPDIYRSPWMLLGFFAALLLVSLASHRWLERPAQAWLRGRRR
jgi:peptidoglycan/LPS O-acetylase OafA/YrhL